MILQNLGALRDDPADFIAVLVITMAALLVALTLHELSHALVATRFGDPTPRRQGRLTLNPVAHLDIFGGLMLLLIGFGWAKPVQVDARYFGRTALRKMSFVALAGPGANLAVAFVASLPFRTEVVDWPFSFNIRTALQFGERADVLLGLFLAFLVVYNLVLAVFNLIPLAPLDGSKVLPGVLPRDLGEAVQRLEPWGPGILMAIIMLSFLNIPILQNTIVPVVNLFASLFVGHRVF